MLRTTRALIVSTATALLLAASASAPARAQKPEGSRGVKIIEAPTLAPNAAPPAAPGALQPASPAQGGIFSPPEGLPISVPANEPLPNLGKPPKGANLAELSVEILPAAEVTVGSQVSFRISAKKEGYLLLVDVDASGKLTQIYPNPMSLVSAAGDRQNSNRIKPGKAVVVPNPADAFAGFEFVASPPQGTAMVVALLSDRPVQMVDLPDLPVNLLGQVEALTYLHNMARELRIPSSEPGRLQEAQWSLDARFYAIR